MTGDFAKRVEACVAARSRAAALCLDVMSAADAVSEYELASSLAFKLTLDGEFASKGWYDPPAGGIAILAGSPRDNFSRLRFDSLRNCEYWPRHDVFVSRGTLAIVYVSPFERHSGLIADYGSSYYRGADLKVRRHLKRCLAAMHSVVSIIEAGMQFREIHEYAQRFFGEHALSNARTITHTDPFGTNLGHTVPWTYEEYTQDERDTLRVGELAAVSALICRKRIFINGAETFRVPRTGAFTFEARLEDSDDPELPNVFFHLLLSFIDGQKGVHA